MKDNRLSLRPSINTIDSTKNLSNFERFQNTTLRPIIKLQHDLIIELFIQYAQKRKTDLQAITYKELKMFIENTLTKDSVLKNQYIGMIVGHFTLNEYKDYTLMSAEIGKRTLQMIRQRLQDTMLINVKKVTT